MNNELYHYGVKGMKWGVRKDRSSNSERRAARKEKRKSVRSKIRNYTGSNRSDALTRARKKDINKMTNAELQNEITRLNLEKQYRSLTRVDIMRGQKKASDYLKYEGTYMAIKKTKAYSRGKKAVAAAVSNDPFVLVTG